VRPFGLVVAATTAAALLGGCAGESTEQTRTEAGPPAPTVTTTSPGGTSPSTGPAGGATTAPPPAAPGVRKVTVAIKDGKVSPPVGRIEVEKGKTVRLTVTTDKADEIHVHGFDKAVPITPGKPTALEFVADRTGQFEVETHETKKILFFLVVR
jgi:hypothetical protein